MARIDREIADKLLRQEGSALKDLAEKSSAGYERVSSAIACYLALGESLPDAVAKARAYIVQAIEQGKNVHTGQGHGPLNHGFAPVAMRVLGG